MTTGSDCQAGMTTRHQLDQAEQAVVNYLVEHGLDPSYMSYEEVAATAVAALRTSGYLIAKLA